MPFQAVLLLQRAFRARRDWAAEMAKLRASNPNPNPNPDPNPNPNPNQAKLRALLGFERASVRGQRKRSGSPTLVERREAASAI